MKKIVLITMILFSIQGYACRCPETTIKKVFKSANIVFSGKVVSVKEEIFKTCIEGKEIVEKTNQLIVEIQITESFKGDLKKTIQIFTGLGNGDCGYRFIADQEYLVFAHNTKDGKIRTSTCDRNIKITNQK